MLENRKRTNQAVRIISNHAACMKQHGMVLKNIKVFLQVTTAPKILSGFCVITCYLAYHRLKPDIMWLDLFFFKVCSKI